LTPSSRKDFSQGKTFFFDQALRRTKQGTKEDGGVFHTPCTDFSRPVEELEYYDTCLLKRTFTEALHVRGFKT